MDTNHLTHSEKMKAKHPFSPFIAYLLLFYGCWIGWVYLIYPPMQALGSATLAYALANIAARVLLWVMPVFVYLRCVDHVHPVVYLKLNQYWKRGILLGLALSLLNFVGMLLRFGPPHPSLHALTWNNVLSTSILIGVFEEISFRGNVLSIFVLGVIFAAIFYVSKTLWSSIITHSLNDFLSSVLFHLS